MSTQLSSYDPGEAQTTFTKRILQGFLRCVSFQLGRNCLLSAGVYWEFKFHAEETL